MDLSPTAYVILGMLSWGPKSGYEIKSIVDHSTRFFWAASYGQIYPELKRLDEAGLITGEDRPQGERRRTVYRLTAKGRSELQGWLAGDPETYELRDEGLLRLFFASADPETAPSTLEAKRRHHLSIVERLREIEATEIPEGFALMVLRYGIELNEWMAGWCEQALSELDKASAKVGA